MSSTPEASSSSAAPSWPKTRRDADGVKTKYDHDDIDTDHAVDAMHKDAMKIFTELRTTLVGSLKGKRDVVSDTFNEMRIETHDFGVEIVDKELDYVGGEARRNVMEMRDLVRRSDVLGERKRVSKFTARIEDHLKFLESSIHDEEKRMIKIKAVYENLTTVTNKLAYFDKEFTKFSQKRREALLDSDTMQSKLVRRTSRAISPDLQKKYMNETGKRIGKITERIGKIDVERETESDMKRRMILDVAKRLQQIAREKCVLSLECLHEDQRPSEHVLICWRTLISLASKCLCVSSEVDYLYFLVSKKAVSIERVPATIFYGLRR